MKKNFDVLNADIRKVFLGYLFPTVLSMIALSVYLLADVMFIGLGIGTDGLAALNITMPVFLVFSGFAQLLGIGAATTLSILVGQGNTEKGPKIFTQAVVTSLIIGGLFSIIGTICIDDYCRLLGCTEELLPIVREYALPINAAGPLFILSPVLVTLVRNDQNPRLAMMASIIGNIFNVVLDWLLIMVFHWGMLGAALPTALAPLITIVILCLHFRQKNEILHFTRHFIDWKLSLRMLRNGFGACIAEVSNGIIIYLFNIILLNISSSAAVALYAIISNVVSVSRSVFNGISLAAQPIISQNHGAAQHQRVQYAVRLTTYISLGFAVVFYAVIFFFPRQCLSLFTSDPALLDTGSSPMILYFSSLVFSAVNTILTFYYQSVEHSTIASTLSFLRGILMILIGLAVLTPLFGENGVWFTVSFAEIFSLLIVGGYLLLHRKKQQPLS